MNLLRKKESEVASLEAELERMRAMARGKRRKTEIEGICNRCKDTEQEIALLKEMVRSQKVMVRAKEIFTRF